MSRLLAIGDLHGYAEPLQVLLDQVGPGPEDTLVFLGDYVDKGPDVAGGLEILLGLADRCHGVFLRGNHDQMLLEACRDESRFADWEYLDGSAETLRSYGVATTRELCETLPDRHLEFLEHRCRRYFETEEFLFVHGGIRAQVDPAEEDLGWLQWAKLSEAAPHFSGRTVVCGHTAQDSGQIADLGHTLCVDTGITKGRFLTCLDLGDFSYLQVSPDLLVHRGRLEGRA